MATYKKRSRGSQKSREEKIEQRSAIAKFFGRLDFWASSFEDWVSRNRVVLFSIIGVIVIGVLGYLAYDNFILQPRQEEAVQEMSGSFDYFNRALQVDPGEDQNEFFERALHGGGGFGLLDIIENYKGTDAANLAYYAAGMAYLHQKEYDKAIEYLKKFKSKDEFLAAVAIGAIGDAYVGDDQPEKGLEYYERAANIRTNQYTTPKYLLKAGITAIQVGKNDKAKALLSRLEKEYPDSSEADNVTAYLGMAEQN